VEYWAEWRSAAIGELPMNSDQARHIRPARAPAERGPAERALVAARSGPTALRIALGAQLRRLREDSHVTVVDAAEAIRATHSKISRLERGRSGAKQRDVADLLTLYGVTDDAQREELLALARQANTPGWWQPYNDVLPSWFELYLGLEKAASIIRL
jgi:transcriptional regulator with XRE-family HTH domain